MRRKSFIDYSSPPHTGCYHHDLYGYIIRMRLKGVHENPKNVKRQMICRWCGTRCNPDDLLCPVCGVASIIAFAFNQETWYGPLLPDQLEAPEPNTSAKRKSVSLTGKSRSEIADIGKGLLRGLEKIAAHQRKYGAYKIPDPLRLGCLHFVDEYERRRRQYSDRKPLAGME